MKYCVLSYRGSVEPYLSIAASNCSGVAIAKNCAICSSSATFERILYCSSVIDKNPWLAVLCLMLAFSTEEIGTPNALAKPSAQVCVSVSEMEGGALFCFKKLFAL